jgi:hypothetical protein
MSTQSNDPQDLLHILREYWRVYGGFSSLVKSPLVWASAILTVLLVREVIQEKWADVPFSVIPSLLGFTIGAMAIVLALPSTRLFKVIADEGAPDSYYMGIAARFVHFVFVQVACLLFAFFFKMTSLQIAGFVSAFFLIYAILTAAAVALSLFDFAIISNNSASIPERGASAHAEPDRSEPSKQSQEN